jgi:hypothetical protein
MLIAFESESGHFMRKCISWIAAEKKYSFPEKTDISLRNARARRTPDCGPAAAKYPSAARSTGGYPGSAGSSPAGTRSGRASPVSGCRRSWRRPGCRPASSWSRTRPAGPGRAHGSRTARRASRPGGSRRWRRCGRPAAAAGCRRCRACRATVGEQAAVPAHARLVPGQLGFRALDVGRGLLEQALAEAELARRHCLPRRPSGR